MKEETNESHHARDTWIDSRSEDGRKNHLDIEVTRFVLADFPLTDEERELLATDEWTLSRLAKPFLAGLDWEHTAEIAVEIWRDRRCATPDGSLSRIRMQRR
jgi:hypothetical protein